MNSTFTFYSDSGHGWLAVPHSELVKLGIESKISGCSYIDVAKDIVYLEEDCDYAEFALAYIAANGLDRADFAAMVSEQHQDGDSFVRGLPRYQAVIA